MTRITGGLMGLDDLRSLLSSGSSDQEDKKPSRPLPEAQVMELTDYLSRYKKPCPFKVGDLVTPRANSFMRNAGDPHIVIEVLSMPRRIWDDKEPSSMINGMILDMRIAMINDGGSLVSFTVSSVDFQSWSES